MEYKIFGPGGSPSEEFREDLTELAKLKAADRDAVADWFFASKDFDPHASPLPANIVASPLLPERFQGAVLALRDLLWAWQEYALELTDIEQDLLLLGVPPIVLATIGPLLGRLSDLKQRVWVWYNAHVLPAGLPRLDDLNFVCEARAIFGGLPVGDSEVRDSYKRFLGIVPLITMELVAVDREGETKRMLVELTEERFEWIRRAVARTHEQFSILKERTAPLAIPDK